MGILVLLIFLLVALILGKMILFRGKDARTSRPRPSPAGRKRAAPRHTVAGREAAADSPGDRLRAKPSAPHRLDLSHLEPAPEGAVLPASDDLPAEILESVVGQAESISHGLCARRAIIDGISRAAHEPRELTELVLSDPVLAGQILKTVNSAFYGLGQPVASVFRAVLLLGHREVSNVVWQVSVSESLGARPGPGGKAVEEIWRHSFATSRVAYAISKALGLAAPDEVSTAALLHDIGKLICLHVRPDLAESLYEPVRFSDVDLLTMEQDRIGVSHARLGGEIARTWGLPEESCTTIARHHAPSYVETGEVDGNHRSIAVVHIADVICHAVDRQRGIEEPGPIYLPDESWPRVLAGDGGLERVCSENVIRALTLPAVTDATASATAAKESPKVRIATPAR